MPFKKTNFFPLCVEYVDEIFNPHPHPHIPHMLIIRIFRIFRIRMANPSEKDDHFHDCDDRHDNMAIIDMGWMINDDCDEYHESDGHWTLH